MKTCDLLVIGGGSGGVRAARLAATQGARVILAEKSALGGTCVNVGCVPKKIFTYAAAIAEDMDSAAAFGWTKAAAGTMHWQTLRDNKNREITRLNEVYAKLLQNSGVEIISAAAHICAPQTAQCGDMQIRADKILLAVGAVPVRPNLPGAEFGVLSDDMFFYRSCRGGRRSLAAAISLWSLPESYPDWGWQPTFAIAPIYRCAVLTMMCGRI